MPEQVDFIGKALSLINSGDADAAVDFLDKTFAETSDNFQALFLKAEALRSSGKFAEAESVFLRALELGPSNGEVLFRLGLTQTSLNKAEAALQSFALASQVAPTHQQAWFYLGTLALQRDILPQAILAFRKAAELDPTSVATLSNLAMCLKRNGDFAEANSVLLQAVNLEPHRDDIAMSLFQGLIDSGDFSSAEQVTRVMAQRFPQSSWWGGAALGWVLRTLNRDLEAAEAYMHAMELDPHSADLAAQAGMALRYAGRLDQAKKLTAKALKLNPKLLNAQIALSAVLSDQGKFDEALEGLESFDGGDETPPVPKRSVVIPILDYSPGSPYNIRTLLEDLKDFDGEVICIFNSLEVFIDLKDHPRIDKYSFNKYNVGVSRSWNMGINQAEGATIHVLNADLHVSVDMLYRLEKWLHELPDALCVGVSAHWYDPKTLKEVRAITTNQMTEPVETDNVSGQLFSLHTRRLNEAGITFDPRLAPYFGEEQDLSLKARQSGLKIYAVPEKDFEHTWGISRRDRPILCFGKPVHRMYCIIRNQALLRRKAQRLAGGKRKK